MIHDAVQGIPQLAKAERLDDIGIGAHFAGQIGLFVRRSACHHDNGHTIEFWPLANPSKDLESGKERHDEIQQNELRQRKDRAIRIGLLALEIFEGFEPVGSDGQPNFGTATLESETNQEGIVGVIVD